MEKSIKPVKINEDVWFYPTKKGFEFTVWSTRYNDHRQCTLFTLPKAKIIKYLSDLTGESKK